MAPAPPKQMIQLVAVRVRARRAGAAADRASALGGRARVVGALVEATGLGAVHVWKHLRRVVAAGFVPRRKKGRYVHYALADDHVFRLCDLVCRRLEAEARTYRKILKILGGA